jgi:hypothetical protein
MDFFGIYAGLVSFLVIGLFHPLIIKGEYHFGKGIWPVFLAGGILMAAGACFTVNHYVSSLLGIAAFACFWSIKELFDQEKRVKRGWFPGNPRRKGADRD